jgi:hypothetical protein
MTVSNAADEDDEDGNVSSISSTEVVHYLYQGSVSAMHSPKIHLE